MQMEKAEIIIERMMLATGTTTLRALAPLLGLRSHTPISAAKAKNAIPRKWLLALEIRHGVNPEWLRTGKGDIHLRSSQNDGVSKGTGDQSPLEFLAESLRSPEDIQMLFAVLGLVIPPCYQPWLDENGAPVLNLKTAPAISFAKGTPLFAGVTLENVAALLMPNRDMEPEIFETDIVYFDRQETRLVHDHLYCIAMGGSLLVRRFAGDRLEFVGDREGVRAIAAEGVRVFGKVAGVLRK